MIRWSLLIVRSVGQKVKVKGHVSLSNLVQRITLERFALEASNLVGRLSLMSRWSLLTFRSVGQRSRSKVKPTFHMLEKGGGALVFYKQLYFLLIKPLWLAFPLYAIIEFLIKFVYWRQNKTHVHFGCNLYQRCIIYVNESVFEMLNVHTCINSTAKKLHVCRTLMIVAIVLLKVYMIKAVFNNRKKKII